MHSVDEAAATVLSSATINFYRESMEVMQEAKIPFLVGGAFAFAQYTGIVRITKDFDVFVAKEDAQRALDALKAAGYHTDLTFPHWLGKAFRGEDFVDVIYGAGNGIAEVDMLWFRYATKGKVFGMEVPLCPAEEMIWSKGYIMERERYDGADVAHLIFHMRDKLDWERLLYRYRFDWRVLLSHLILFGFIYPGHRDAIPASVLDSLVSRLKSEGSVPEEDLQLCQGTLISRQQYLIDLERGFEDARVRPRGKMTEGDVEHWTAAIDKKE